MRHLGWLQGWLANWLADGQYVNEIRSSHTLHVACHCAAKLGDASGTPGTGLVTKDESVLR